MTVETQQQDLSGSNALCVGASQGIGAGVAIECARRNASVIVVGRNEDLLKNVVDQMRSASAAPGALFDYVVADLSTIDGIKAAVAQVKTKATKLDYIVQTQGATPNGVFQMNHDGYDKNFTVQVLSRFAFPYLLAKSGKFEGSVVSVCAPGGTEIDVTDLDLGKAHSKGQYGSGLRHLPKAGNRDSACIDAFTLEFKERFPSCTAAHVFPGIVASTNAGRNLPSPIPAVFGLVSAPLAYVGILHNTTSYAHIPVNLATSRANGLFKGANTVVTPSAWMADKGNRAAIWDGLVKILG